MDEWMAERVVERKSARRKEKDGHSCHRSFPFAGSQSDWIEGCGRDTTKKEDECGQERNDR